MTLDVLDSVERDGLTFGSSPSLGISPSYSSNFLREAEQQVFFPCVVLPTVALVFWTVGVSGSSPLASSSLFSQPVQGTGARKKNVEDGQVKSLIANFNRDGARPPQS